MAPDRWLPFLRTLLPTEAILLGLYLYLGNRGVAVSDQAGGFWGAALLILIISAWRTSGGRGQQDAVGAQRARAVLNALGEQRGDLVADLARALERLVGAAQEDAALRAAILDHSPVGIVLVNGDGEILLRNAVLAEMFALSSSEMQAASLSQLLRHYQFVDLWRKAREEDTPQALTEEVPQSRRTLNAMTIPLQGELAGQFLLLFQDVSELRRLETVRRDFVSNVSHELRTPLTSLKALTESLRDGALEEPETAKRFLAHMETEVDALSELVAELLELARIESHRAPLQLAAADPCTIIARSVERLRLQADRAGLQVRVDCPADLPQINADATRLEQVLVNLIHNAVKFTPSGGQVTVSAEAQRAAVAFRVEDTGVGMDPEVLPRIFERFYKTDPARNKGGTGLGLAISKHLVESHGGRIWAESELGQGSRLYFTIPRTAG
jgi:two-component system phosphate regulon sensor histidine kinase PhoR